MSNTLFGLPVHEDDTLPSAAGVKFLPFSYPVRAVYLHPDMLAAGIGDTYQGIPIHRDERIPYGEIHIHTGTHFVKMTYKGNPHA